MKKLFLSVGLLLTTMIFAQKKWAVEVKMGINNSSAVSSDEAADFKSGLVTGVLGSYLFSNDLNVKSGFLYDQRGYKGSETTYTGECLKSVIYE